MSLEHRHAILDALMSVLDEDTAASVVEYRKGLGRKHVLTERSARMMAKQLAKFPDPIAAAEEMILRGWQTIKPEWVQRNHARPQSIVGASLNLMEQMNGATSHRGNNGAAQFLPATVRH